MAKRTCLVDGCERKGNDPGGARGLCNLHYLRWKRHGSTDDPRPSLWDRFWEKVEVGHPLGCWEWTGDVGGHGYGQFWRDGTARAHRVAYELLMGPIPDGLILDHLCRNTVCVNPDHLEPVTHAENRRRARSKGAHCKRGHLMDSANTVRRPDGKGSTCRRCTRQAERERRARQRATRPLSTHCRKGHALTDDNLCASKDGRRRCLICRRANVANLRGAD